MKYIIVCCSLLLTPGVFGSSFTSRKCSSEAFMCSNREQCIGRHQWCDGNDDCGDYSDEEYCNSDYGYECDRNLYFQCDKGGCVPLEGKCDGYPWCPDGSDELGCPCEEILEEIGSIRFQVLVGLKRSSKCWKIKVPSTKYLKLNITNLILHGTNCNDVSLAISGEKMNVATAKFCSKSSDYITEKFDTTEIRYHGSVRYQYRSNRNFDSFNIGFSVSDVLCKRSDSVECTPNLCVPLEKKCDGVNDCLNAADEHGCERGVLTVPNVNITLDQGIRWLKKERNAAWGWRDNTHRAVVAMYLAHGANFNGSNQEEDLTSKQLEMRMLTSILRNETDPIPPTQLAMYINALLVICHDPKNFYGFNLLRILRDQMQFPTNSFQPLPYLALCNANETLTDYAVQKLLSILDSSSEHGFLLDVQSVAVMALTCVSRNSNSSNLISKINETTNMFKNEQNQDGSFGNIYTTALVIQALLSSGKEEDRDWDLKAAIELLQQKQNPVNGSFGDLLATTMILPIFNAKSLVDIRNINCTENLKMPRDGNPVTDIELRLGQKISIQYCLYIGNEKDQIHPITLRTPSNITVLDIMRLAAEADPKYRFEAQSSKGKLYVYKLSGISNDPEDGKFWLLYIKPENETLQITSKSPDEIAVNDKDDIIMWYRSATIE